MRPLILAAITLMSACGETSIFSPSAPELVLPEVGEDGFTKAEIRSLRSQLSSRRDGRECRKIYYLGYIEAQTVTGMREFPDVFYLGCVPKDPKRLYEFYYKRAGGKLKACTSWESCITER